MSTKQRRVELITYGYTRNVQGFSRALPIVLINLIRMFYDEVVHWNVEGQKLKQFLNAKHRECVMAPRSFTAHDIKFRMSVFPDGHIESAEGYVGYFLSVLFIPSSIQCFSIYLVLECEVEPGHTYNFKDVVRWTRNDMNSSDGWYSQPKLSDLAQVKAMHFSCFIDFLYVCYETETPAAAETRTTTTTTEASSSPNNTANCSVQQQQQQQPLRIDYIKEFYIAKECQYVWRFDEEYTERIKQIRPKIAITSENFGHNAWCLEFIPNGDRFLIVKQCAMFIKLVAFPVHIKEIEIVCTLRRNTDIEKKLEHIKLTHAQNNSGHWMGEVLSASTKKKMELSVEVQIINVVDDNDNSVDASLWSKHGII